MVGYVSISVWWGMLALVCGGVCGALVCGGVC